MAHNAVFGEGFQTTVFPQTAARKAFHDQTATGKLKSAKPGGLIAIGTLLDPSLTQNDRMRGQVIGKPDTVPNSTKELHIELHMVERLITDVPKEIELNETIVITAGTMTAVGIVTKKTGSAADVALKNSVVVENGQKIVISKRDGTRWRLVAYGVCK